MRDWLRDRPWFWIVLLISLFVILDLILVYIAVSNRPTVIG